MEYFGRVVGVAALALSTTLLSACYAPPPPEVGMAAPYQTPGYPAGPVATVTPDQTPAYPAPAYPPIASAAPTPLSPYSSNYATPQYGSTGPVAQAPSNAGTTIVVAPYAPPPPQAETPPPTPSALAMWQPGHWGWNGTQYSWASGHYVERPSPSANWTPGYWQQGPAGWTWTNGYWS